MLGWDILGFQPCFFKIDLDKPDQPSPRKTQCSVVKILT